MPSTPSQPHTLRSTMRGSLTSCPCALATAQRAGGQGARGARPRAQLLRVGQVAQGTWQSSGTLGRWVRRGAGDSMGLGLFCWFGGRWVLHRYAATAAGWGRGVSYMLHANEQQAGTASGSRMVPDTRCCSCIMQAGVPCAWAQDCVLCNRRAYDGGGWVRWCSVSDVVPTALMISGAPRSGLLHGCCNW